MVRVRGRVRVRVWACMQDTFARARTRLGQARAMIGYLVYKVWARICARAWVRFIGKWIGLGKELKLVM